MNKEVRRTKNEGRSDPGGHVVDSSPPQKPSPPSSHSLPGLEKLAAVI